VPRTRRYLDAQVRRDLLKKMVFVAGPRQVGKTTLAKSLPSAAKGYLNWDVAADRDRILRGELPPNRLWIFDEIHKHRSWRGFLKGLYDSRRPAQQILVTGSARLDLYRHGGDSLQGRYHLLRLHPLSVAELKLSTTDGLRSLLTLGGFPEPFFGGSEVEARRWSREYRNRQRAALFEGTLSRVRRLADQRPRQQRLCQPGRNPGVPGAALSRDVSMRGQARRPKQPLKALLTPRRISSMVPRGLCCRRGKPCGHSWADPRGRHPQLRRLGDILVGQDGMGTFNRR